eukprot:667679-Rhodomonas_salina.4
MLCPGPAGGSFGSPLWSVQPRQPSSAPTAPNHPQVAALLGRQVQEARSWQRSCGGKQLAFHGQEVDVIDAAGQRVVGCSPCEKQRRVPDDNHRRAWVRLQRERSLAMPVQRLEHVENERCRSKRVGRKGDDDTAAGVLDRERVERNALIIVVLQGLREQQRRTRLRCRGVDRSVAEQRKDHVPEAICCVQRHADPNPRQHLRVSSRIDRRDDQAGGSWRERRDDADIEHEERRGEVLRAEGWREVKASVEISFDRLSIRRRLDRDDESKIHVACTIPALLSNFHASCVDIKPSRDRSLERLDFV